MVVARKGKGCGMINSTGAHRGFDLGKSSRHFEIVSQIGRNLFVKDNIVISKRTSSEVRDDHPTISNSRAV